MKKNKDATLYDVLSDYTLAVADVQEMPDMKEHSKKNSIVYGIAMTELFNIYDELVFVIAHKDLDITDMCVE